MSDLTVAELRAALELRGAERGDRPDYDDADSLRRRLAGELVAEAQRRRGERAENRMVTKAPRETEHLPRKAIALSTAITGYTTRRRCSLCRCGTSRK